MSRLAVTLLSLTLLLAGAPLRAESGLNLLDVGVVVLELDPDVLDQPGAYPRVRRVESTYLPVLLRNALVDSGDWGVVRVLPEASALAHLSVSMTALESTGLQLTLQVRVSDATGAVWIDRRYSHVSTADSYPVSDERDPFAPLYNAVAADMLDYRDALTADQLRTIRRVAFLRYAHSLSPGAFAGYLDEREGRFSVQRLPARDDDMVSRVERIRNQEYLFIDSVDEQYVELQRAMAPAYDLWRQYDREQIVHRAEYQARVAERDRQGRRGSFAAMQQAYNEFKVAKMQEQDVRELARGFDNETAPTVLETDGRVYNLTGTLDTRYREWRDILQQIFALETGLSPPA